MSSTAPAVSAPPATAPRVVRDEWRIRYEYPTGEVAARFFDALKERRIVATHCSASGMTYLPPRAYCERSFERCDGFVEAGSEGTIEAATIVSAAFENLPPPPYAIAYVRLDGVSTAMLNFVHGLDLSDVPAAARRLQPGTRVRVAFIDQPQGRVTDFHYLLA
ncbi:MAG: DNA-binding protein [Variovorax sp.]|jgi:uncharacterized protein|nr:MAG: DNA-binding protein [Variovorax sp.]